MDYRRLRHGETIREAYVTKLEADVERLQARLGCVVRNCQHIDDSIPRDEPGPMCGPTWAKVAHICGMGSTSAIELCKSFDVDPHYDCDDAPTTPTNPRR